jgi:hypothetical protein
MPVPEQDGRRARPDERARLRHSEPGRGRRHASAEPLASGGPAPERPRPGEPFREDGPGGGAVIAALASGRVGWQRLTRLVSGGTMPFFPLMNILRQLGHARLDCPFNEKRLSGVRAGLGGRGKPPAGQSLAGQRTAGDNIPFGLQGFLPPLCPFAVRAAETSGVPFGDFLAHDPLLQEAAALAGMVEQVWSHQKMISAFRREPRASALLALVRGSRLDKGTGKPGGTVPEPTSGGTAGGGLLPCRHRTNP